MVPPSQQRSVCLIEAARQETAPRKVDSDVTVYIREQRGSLCQLEAPEGGDVLRECVSGPQFPYIHNGKREEKGFIHRKPATHGAAADPQHRAGETETLLSWHRSTGHADLHL